MNWRARKLIKWLRKVVEKIIIRVYNIIMGYLFKHKEAR